VNIKLVLTVFFLIAPACLSHAYDDNRLYRLLESGRLSEAAAIIEQNGDSRDAKLWKSRIKFYGGDYSSAGNVASENSGYFLKLAMITKNFSAAESSHFVFKARGYDVILSTYALTALEMSYTEIGADLGAYPENKILVEVYPNKEEFSFASTIPLDIIEKTGTVGICKFNRIMLLSPNALPLGYRWLDTLSHEYTHYLVNYISVSQCPLWLHEGIARYHDTRWRLAEPLFLTPDAKNRLADSNKAGTYVTFKKMSPSLIYLKDQDEIALAFAEVSAAVDFMKKNYGPDALRLLLSGLSSLPYNKSFKSSVGVSEASFENKFRKYLGGLGLERAVGTVSDLPVFYSKPEDEYIGADAAGKIRLGDKFRQLGNMAAAAAQYSGALELEPANPLILLKLSRSLLASGDEKKAEQYLLSAIEKNPNYVTPYQALGELYYKQARYPEAIKAFCESIAINPFYENAHLYLANSYIYMGNLESAKTEQDILGLFGSRK